MSWLLTLLLVLLVLTSVLGNFLVCLAVKTDKTLRKLSNLFLVSLALADLFVKKTKKNYFVHNLILKVAMFVMPFAIINDITGEWPLGEKACKIWIRFVSKIRNQFLFTQKLLSKIKF